MFTLADALYLQLYKKDMTQSLILSVFSVFLMMVPGFVLSKRGVLSDKFLKDLTRLIVQFIYPCLAFSSVLKNFSLEVLIQNWQLPFASVVITFVGYFTARISLLVYKIKNGKTRSSFEYLCTFNNYIFLPLAIISQIMEPEFVAAVVISSLGAEFLVWSLGVFIMKPGSKLFSKESFTHLLSPPLIALFLAISGLIILYFSGWDLQKLLTDIVVAKYFFNSLNTLGAATVPLTLILAGARIAQTKLALVHIKVIWFISILRLVIIPLIAILVLKLVIPNNEFLIVLFIVSITPVAFNSMVMGELFQADMDVISGTVLISYFVSLITIPIWVLILL